MCWGHDFCNISKCLNLVRTPIRAAAKYTLILKQSLSGSQTKKDPVQPDGTLTGVKAEKMVNGKVRLGPFAAGHYKLAAR
jgi:hypothetical protein